MIPDLQPKWLSDQAFTQAVAALPLVSLDLVVINPHAQILLGLRKHSPAKGWWFTPGGRIRKNEPWQKALERIWSQEVTQIDSSHTDRSMPFSSAESMGVWDHFYDDSALSLKVSTHYVNLPHFIALTHNWEKLGLADDQHSAWRWLNLNEAMVAPDVHRYVKPYVEWALMRM